MMNWESHKTAVLDETKINYLDKYLLNDNTIKNVLEIGTATGIYANYLACKDKKITAVDINVNLQKKAKSKYKNKNITFVKADVEKLKYKNKYFDSCIIFDVLEHVDDKKAIKNIEKVTKNIIIGSVPRTTDKDLTKNYLLFGHHLDITHKKTYTVKELKNLFKNNLNYKKIIIRKSHPISTEGLLVDVLEGNKIIKKILRRLIFIFAKPKIYYSNLMFVLYLK